MIYACMRAVQICMLARAARSWNFFSIFNCGGHKSIKNNRSMHSPDRLGIDYLHVCIDPIDYLWLLLRIDTLRYATYRYWYYATVPVPVLVQYYSCS
eukprot:COSAG05_NODE_512_length_9090_cov_33.937827_3_plen_97_part_00